MKTIISYRPNVCGLCTHTVVCVNLCQGIQKSVIRIYNIYWTKQLLYVVLIVLFSSVGIHY